MAKMAPTRAPPPSFLGTKKHKNQPKTLNERLTTGQGVNTKQFELIIKVNS